MWFRSIRSAFYAMQELIVLVLVIAVPIGLLCGVAFFTQMWFEGTAKSAYLKQVQGVDLPWYQAAFIPVTTTDLNAKVKQE